MKKHGNYSTDVISNIGCFIIAMAMFTGLLCAFGPILQMLSPLITLLFVLFLTGFTLERRLTTFLSVSGIVLYIVCWPIALYENEMLGQVVCMIGILMWFGALGLTLLPQKKKLQITCNTKKPCPGCGQDYNGRFCYNCGWPN